MPFPHTRRLFLQRGLTMLSATATIPLFLDNTVMALARPDDVLRTQQDSGKDGKILVVVQLSGGNDGLNTVIPHGDDAYYRERPGIGIARDKVLKVNDYIGLNPNLAPLKALFDEGSMSVIQGVGYPNPNRSHFRSMDIWHTGDPMDERNLTGWLGRYFDACCSGEDAKVGVAMGEVAPLAMKGEKLSGLSLERPDAYRYRGSAGAKYLDLNQPTTKPSAAAAPSVAAKSPKKTVSIATPDDQLNFLSRTALDAQASSDQILRAVNAHQPKAQYPRGEFGDGLRTVAAMIRGELPTRVYYVTLGGFDTHANQQGRHDQLMATLAQGVSAFWADMKDQKNDQRVLMMTFSEFGRRVSQNASQGTDHGAAAPMFLLGRNVKEGVIGRHPSLTDLDAGDLKFGVDFRSVYASILQDWLNAPSKPILGKQFPTFEVVRG
ncbi:MAG: DUF1501 domain-containing protein [Tepidisphaeraceae bacterium]